MIADELRTRIYTTVHAESGGSSQTLPRTGHVAEFEAAIVRLERRLWLARKYRHLNVALSSEAVIAAQLDILRTGLRWAEMHRDGKVPDFAADYELALARAINERIS